MCVPVTQNSLDHCAEPNYSGDVRRHRLNKGEALFKRTRYQHGSLEREERKKGPEVWVYRWWEEDIDGKTRTPQAADRGCGNIPERICRTCGSGRSSINHQQSLQSPEPATNHDQHGFGSTISARNCRSRHFPRKTRTSCMRRIGSCRAGARFSCRRSRQSKSSAGYGLPTSQTGPKPRSSASCRLCSRTRSVGNSAATIRSHREYRLGAVANGVRVRAYG